MFITAVCVLFLTMYDTREIIYYLSFKSPKGALNYHACKLNLICSPKLFLGSNTTSNVFFHKKGNVDKQHKPEYKLGLHFVPGGTPREYGWRCGPLLTLALFQTNKCDFPHSISDLTQNSIPYLRPAQELLRRVCVDV